MKQKVWETAVRNYQEKTYMIFLINNFNHNSAIPTIVPPKLCNTRFSCKKNNVLINRRIIFTQIIKLMQKSKLTNVPISVLPLRFAE